MSATLPRAREGRAYVVRLPDGRSVTVAEYVASWRRLKVMDPRASVRGFNWFPQPAGDVLEALRGSIHDRINRHLPWSQETRKWSPIWQRDMARAARDLNHPRLVISWLPSDLRERFGHRLRNLEDY